MQATTTKNGKPKRTRTVKAEPTATPDRNAGFLKFGEVLGAHAAFRDAIDEFRNDPDAASLIAAGELDDDLLELSYSTDEPMRALLDGVGRVMAD